MTFKDIVAQLLERGNAMQSFWGFYITISLGLIAFCGNAKHTGTGRSFVLAALLSLAFVAFAYVNCDGMTDIAAQREYLYSQLDAAAQLDAASGQEGRLPATGMVESLKEVTKPPAEHQVRQFHIGADIAVFIAIWTLTLWHD
jgi:hypothetical protein